MKTAQKIVFTLLGLFFCEMADAQYRSISPECYIGVGAGATMSTASFVPLYVDKTYLFAANGGVSFRYIAEKNFGIQTEFNYFQCGWKDDYGYGSTDFYQRNIALIEIPFLMHAYLGEKNVRFFLNAGPKFSWILSNEESIRSSHTSADIPYYGKSIENNFQWGLAGGAGFEVHIQKVVLGMEGRYCYGFSDLYHNALTDDFVTSSLQQISLNLYCLFQLR